MELSDEATIWRYMDLGKFLSLMNTRTLFFASIPSLSSEDPFETYLTKARREIHFGKANEALESLLSSIASLHLPPDQANRIQAALREFRATIILRLNGIMAGFGVSCWHESETESAAMWQLYSDSGKGIAVESTVGRLRQALGRPEKLDVERVEYLDFETASAEEGTPGFSKRLCFSHEREVRAMLPLSSSPEGASFPCDLDILVTRVHISPRSHAYVEEAVSSVCKGAIRGLDKPVLRSALFDPPEWFPRTI